MFPLSLAPTSAPKRWYSNQHSIQDEFDELAYLEAKFVHDREQALEVRCPIIVPHSFSNSNVNNSHNNNNSMDDPSIDDMAPQDGIDNSGIIPSGEADTTFMDDDPPMNNNNDPDGDGPGSVSFLSQHNELHSEQPSSSSPQPQYYQNSISSSSYTPTMISTRSYSTPNRITSTSHLQSNFFTIPTPATTMHHRHHQSTPSSATSPDLVDYLSPPPAARSLRQYMDDSSRGFMEPEMLDRLIRYDDDDDHGSSMISLQSNHLNDDNEDERRRLRRSNLFD